MPSLTLLAGQISDAVEVGPGTRVTATGSGYVEWTTGTLVDVRNGAATWQTWPKGQGVGQSDTMRRMCIRGVATGALTVTWDEGFDDAGADDAFWQEQVPAWATDANGNATGLVGPGGGVMHTTSSAASVDNTHLDPRSPMPYRTTFVPFGSTAQAIAASGAQGTVYAFPASAVSGAAVTLIEGHRTTALQADTVTVRPRALPFVAAAGASLTLGVNVNAVVVVDKE
jgi:hypothetical protein